MMESITTKDAIDLPLVARAKVNERVWRIALLFYCIVLPLFVYGLYNGYTVHGFLAFQWITFGIVCLGIPGFYALMVWSRLTWIEVGENGVKQISPLGNSRDFAWENVEILRVYLPQGRLLKLLRSITLVTESDRAIVLCLHDFDREDHLLATVLAHIPDAVEIPPELQDYASRVVAELE